MIAAVVSGCAVDIMRSSLEAQRLASLCSQMQTLQDDDTTLAFFFFHLYCVWKCFQSIYLLLLVRLLSGWLDRYFLPPPKPPSPPFQRPFSGDPGLVGSQLVFFVHLFWERTYVGQVAQYFLQAGCLSCHQG